MCSVGWTEGGEGVARRVSAFCEKFFKYELKQIKK